MSHTVVRGKPNAAQLYLDTVLDAILIEQGLVPDRKGREHVTLSQIMFHCLKKRPDHVFMINGSTGEKITNEQILKRAVSLARALTARGATRKYAMLIMRNHQEMAALYFAVMFAGMIPFMMDPNSTVYEQTHFLNLIEPTFVFHDQEFEESLLKAQQGCEDLNPTFVMADEPEVLKQFIAGHSDDVNSFQVAEASIDDVVMMLPTSGSTGLPKAAYMTHRGLVMQLPSPWSYHTQFPTPTSTVMLLTTLQWMTFTMFVTASTAYHVTLLMTPRKTSVDHVVEITEKYRPTFTFLAPAFATNLVDVIRADQMSSLETVILLGAPPAPELLSMLQSKLPKGAHLCDGYGTTETHGFIAIPDREAPLRSNGWVYNFMYYKIVDDEGRTLGPEQAGELWVKGDCVLKGYHKNDSTYQETVTADGWFRTGDVFQLDHSERISFVVRKKFSFKYKGCQVAPEEVERVISSVAGVNESVVCASDSGPVAAVVLLPKADVTRDQIHKAVDAALSDHKRLHGGIAFVPSLPHTHSGKLKRLECSKLIEDLRRSGQCY
ncbi:uncharacterized protein LOC110371735 [Helicoverpa armigera]|uniref:uncharacterized protein LOC110371735 n=1 Tax=Helicoverpa armigera TaxID=29058 RepID=UPI003082A5D9